MTKNDYFRQMPPNSIALSLVIIIIIIITVRALDLSVLEALRLAGESDAGLHSIRDLLRSFSKDPAKPVSQQDDCVRRLLGTLSLNEPKSRPHRDIYFGLQRAQAGVLSSGVLFGTAEMSPVTTNDLAFLLAVDILAKHRAMQLLRHLHALSVEDLQALHKNYWYTVHSLNFLKFVHSDLRFQALLEASQIRTVLLSWDVVSHALLHRLLDVIQRAASEGSSCRMGFEEYICRFFRDRSSYGQLRYFLEDSYLGKVPPGLPPGPLTWLYWAERTHMAVCGEDMDSLIEPCYSIVDFSGRMLMMLASQLDLLWRTWQADQRRLSPDDSLAVDRVQTLAFESINAIEAILQHSKSA